MTTEETETPDKSVIEIKPVGSMTFKKIKLLGNEGTFIYSPLCLECSFLGEVQLTIEPKLVHTCDRNMESRGTWKKCTAIYTQARKKCKFFNSKEDTDG